MSPSNLFKTHLLLPVLLIIVSSTVPIPIHAQVGHSTITGQVTDAATGAALYFANVFLAGTTYGDATDRNGYFVIHNIPPGSYELVASMMGYEVQKKRIKLFNGRNVTLHFGLDPKIIEGEEVTITAEDATEWRERLKIFERLFFGIKEFAGDCKLLNPEILNFEFDRDSGLFRAFTELPLRFVNNALGYEVTFFMDEFEATLINDDLYVLKKETHMGLRGVSFRAGKRVYNGMAQFIDLIPRLGENNKWKKNRVTAYKGSRRHFFRSLIDGRLKKEGFKINGSKSFSQWHDYNVKADTLLRQVNEDSEYSLRFPNLLKVVYTKERDEIMQEIRTSMLLQLANPIDPGIDRSLARIAAECAHQESWLEIVKGGSVTIKPDGIAGSSLGSLATYGYWSWDAAAEWLPTDYVPPEENF